MKRQYIIGGNGSKTNLYLDPHLKAEGKRIAKNRYKTSLSGLVEMLILAESKRKRGIAHLVKEAA
jgi:hypothetical protein